MADVTDRPQPPRGSPPAAMPLWPWLVAPALMLFLIVGFSVAGLLLVKRDGVAAAPQATEPDKPAVGDPRPSRPPPPAAKEQGDSAAAPKRPARVEGPPPGDPAPVAVAPFFPTRRPQAAPDLEVAASSPGKETTAVTELPKLSGALLLTPKAGAAAEVAKPSPERERLYDAVVDRFILYDVGRLRGADGQKAKLAFDALGPDSLPALVRGINRAAGLQASCPVFVISAKLQALLTATNDLDALVLARDDIGKGVGLTPHAAYLIALSRLADDRLKKSQELLKPRVPQFIAALKSKDAATRRNAANTLGLLGPDAKAAVPGLIDALKDGDAAVRGTAARALAEVGPAAAPALLAAAAKAPDKRQRVLATLALGEIRPPASDAVRLLVESLKDDDGEVRAAAALAAGRLGDVAVAPLREALRRKDAGAALALAQVGPPAVNAAIPDLVAALRDDDKALRVAAHHALVRVGAPAVPALAAALDGAELREWYSISVALGKIGADARAAVPALVRALGHDDKGVRVLAANALAQIDPGNEAVGPVLGEAVPALVEVLRQRDGAARLWAAASLGKMGPGAAGAVPALVVALSDPDAPVRAAAADALARLGKAAVPALVASLKDDDDGVRRAATEALGRIGAGAVPDLVTATRAADERVRRGAVAALAAVGPDAGAAVPALVDALKDQDQAVCVGAAHALGALRPEKPAAAEALLKRLQGPDDDLRTACRAALVRIGRGAAVPLAGALTDDSAATRRTALELLQKIGPEAGAAVPALCAAAKDGDAPLRAAALDTLRDVLAPPAAGKPDAAGAAALQAVAAGLRDGDGDVRIAAHLGMIRLGRAAAPALAAALAEKDAAVRRLAAETLKKLGPEATAAAPALVAALKDADAEVREGAGWALEAVDPELRAALPALRKALAGPPKPVPAAAPSKRPCYWTVAELAAVAGGEPGDDARAALRELALRQGEPALRALALAVVSPDAATQAVAREMLVKCLTDRPDDKAEGTAARRLKLDRQLLKDGEGEQACDGFRRLIKAQPRTRAAEEARGLLARAGERGASAP